MSHDIGPERELSVLLRSYRRAARLSQQELAERAGISIRALSDIERGVSRSPHRDTIQLLTSALNLTPAEVAALQASTLRRLADEPRQPTRPVQGSTRLVGRDEEIHLLARHIAGEGPPVFLVAGEPGSGKSRLLAEAAALATGAGMRVLASGCQRSAGEEPYAPLPGALKQSLHDRSTARLRADLRGCEWLVRLLPELAQAPIEAPPAWKLAPAQERRLIVEAVNRYLTAIAGPAGVMLMLDDLQWAAGDCLELLAAILQSRPPRLRVLAAYRSTELSPGGPLLTTLADLAHAGLARHHALSPLPPASATELLYQALAADGAEDILDEDPAAVDLALQRAGGLPFVLLSYAGALKLRRTHARSEPTLPVPWDVAQSLRQRVAALDEPARSVLQVAAVVGREATLAVLLPAVNRPESETIAAIDAAARAGLLLDQGTSYRFAHDVIREVVDHDIGSARRRAIHRQVVDAIEALPGDAISSRSAALGYHCLQGELWGHALPHLTRAARDAIAAGASVEALDRLGQIIELCRRLGPTFNRQLADALEERANLLLGITDPQRSLADFSSLAELAAVMDDRRLQAFAISRRGYALMIAHRFEEAEASLRDAFRIAGDAFPEVELFALVQLAMMLVVINRHREGEELLLEAQALAARVQAPLGLSLLDDIMGLVMEWRGDFDASLQWIERWRRDAAHDTDLVDRLSAEWLRALACAGRGEYDRALKVLDELVTTAERFGEVWVRGRALNTVGWILSDLHHGERALAFNRAALELAESSGFADLEIVNNSRVNIGDSLRALGRDNEAEAYYAVVEEIVRNPRPDQLFGLWRYSQRLFHSLGELWLARGDVERAARYAEECLHEALASESKKNVVKARRLRAQVMLAHGERAAAVEEAEQAFALAREVGNPPQLWRTYAVLGATLESAGRADDARQAFESAVQTVEAVAQNLQDAALRASLLGSDEVMLLRQTLDRFTLARKHRATS